MEHEFITPNQVTPHIGSVSDLRKGPVVLEVPAKSDKAVLYCHIVDADKEPYPRLRLYAPEEPFWNKSFKMPDVELVK